MVAGLTTLTIQEFIQHGSGFPTTQRATFTMSGALHGMSLKFQMKQNLQREEWWHVHHNPGKDLGEASAGGSCHCCHGNWGLTSVSHSPGIPATRLYWSLLLPLGPLRLLAASLLEPSLFRTRQLSGSCLSQLVIGYWSLGWLPASHRGIL